MGEAKEYVERLMGDALGDAGMTQEYAGMTQG